MPHSTYLPHRMDSATIDPKLEQEDGHQVRSSPIYILGDATR